MLHPVIATSLAVALVVLASSGGAQSPLTLDCRYRSTLDTATLKTDGTSGGFSALVRFEESAPGRPAVIIETTKSGPCNVYGGAPSALEISGRCETELKQSDGSLFKIERFISINRVSGTFEEHVTMNRKGGLIHYGQCTAAQRQF
jgi:hypothetical protein